MTSRSIQRLIWTILGAALLLLGAFALRSWMHSTETHRQLLDLGTVPEFHLTDQNGNTITRDSLAGKIWVGDLIFTHCTTFCPQLTSKMKELSTKVPSDGSVQLVSISVDPTHDSPDTLRDYIKLHNLETSHWTFLTGPVPITYTLVKHGFHLPLDSVGGDQANYPIIHSPRFVLIDQKGHMRGYYNGLDSTSQRQILDDIETLRDAK